MRQPTVVRQLADVSADALVGSDSLPLPKTDILASFFHVINHNQSDLSHFLFYFLIIFAYILIENSSPAMEFMAFKQCMQYLIGYGLVIKAFISFQTGMCPLPAT